MGVPQNGRFIRKTPIKMNDDWGYPHFGKPLVGFNPHLPTVVHQECWMAWPTLEQWTRLWGLEEQQFLNQPQGFLGSQGFHKAHSIWIWDLLTSYDYRSRIQTRKTAEAIWHCHETVAIPFLWILCWTIQGLTRAIANERKMPVPTFLCHFSEDPLPPPEALINLVQIKPSSWKSALDEARYPETRLSWHPWMDMDGA